MGAVCLALAGSVALADNPVLPAGVTDAGSLPAEAQVQASIYLLPPADRRAALAQFLTDVQTPGSANYHHWLTPDQFAHQYGATADQIARVEAFAENAGLNVIMASGLRLVVLGSDQAIEAAFGPALHNVSLNGQTLVAPTAPVAVPESIEADVVEVSGMTTLPEATPMALSADGQLLPSGGRGAVEDLAAAVEADAARVLTLNTTACASAFTTAAQTETDLLLQQAAAQGMTVLASSGCSTSADVSFPAVLPEVTSVAPASGVTNDAGFLADETRPAWQNVPGLPQDSLRHEPDVAASSLSALANTLVQILVSIPANADGTPARLGNINQALYELAPEPGLYIQPDATASDQIGHWEQATGLGLVNLTALAKAYPRGTKPAYNAVTTTPPYAIHGTSITFTAAIKDTSATSTAPPSGTVTFTTSPEGYPLGTAYLIANSTSSATTSVAYNQLPAGSYNVIASYSGDANYAASTSQTSLTIGPEEGKLAGTVSGTTPFGSNIQLNITDTSASGVGTPSVTATVVPQGVGNAPSLSTKLSGRNGVATGAVSVLASQAGAMTLQISCTSSDPSFTCGNSTNLLATVSKATPAVTLVTEPSTPVAGQPTQFTATVTGLANMSAPSGTVSFFDNGVNVGQATIDPTASQATVSATKLTAGTTHRFTATYSGDANYTPASSSHATKKAQNGTTPSTTSLASSASTVVSGGTITLTATVGSGAASTTITPTGTVTFTSATQGVLGTAPLNASGVATLTATLTTAGTQTITASYGGDTTYTTSSSPAASITVSPTITPTITLSINPTTTTYGAGVTLTSTINATPTAGSTPAGTITWTLTPNAGGVPVVYTAALVGTGTTTATASASVAAPATGTYTVTATCFGTNIACTSVSASAGLAVTKTSAAMTLTASPSTPSVNQPELLTATVAPNSGSGQCGGAVTFYVNGASAGTATLSNNQAVLVITLPSLTKDLLYAVYSGDNNCTANMSSTITLSIPLTATTGTVTPSSNTVLQSASVTFTALVSSVATATNPYPGAPSGTVTFYDTYNGQQTTLGTGTLVQNGPSSSVASFTTTGLQDGSHTVNARFGGSTYFSPVDAGTTVVNVTDFSITMAPPTATVSAGQTLSVLATVVPVNGFTGEISLSCTPPAGTNTSCSFAPSVLSNGGGVATLTITTTARTTGSLRPAKWGSSLSFALMLGVFCWPTRRKRMPLLVAVAGILFTTGLVGCTTVRTETSTTGGGSGTTSTTGTPAGTQLFTITAAGTDGRTTNRHTQQFQLTIQ